MSAAPAWIIVSFRLWDLPRLGDSAATSPRRKNPRCRLSPWRYRLARDSHQRERAAAIRFPIRKGEKAMSRAETTAREQERQRLTCARMLRIAIAVAVVFVSQVQVGTALAANPVTDLTVAQNDGYATLAWTPVSGASDYQVERTIVNADGSLGTATIVGVWQAQRTITPGVPEVRRRGLRPGRAYQWRVRARFGTTAQDYSAPVVQATRPQWGSGPAPRCERSGRRAATRRTRRTRTSSSTPRRSMPPAIACAWSSSAARIRWRAATRPPATARSTCSSSAGHLTSRRSRPRRRSRVTGDRLQLQRPRRRAAGT